MVGSGAGERDELDGQQLAAELGLPDLAGGAVADERRQAQLLEVQGAAQRAQLGKARDEELALARRRG